MATLNVPRGASFKKQASASPQQQQQQHQQLQSALSRMFQLYEGFRSKHFSVSSNTLRPEDLTQSGNGSGVWTRGFGPGGGLTDETGSPVFKFQEALSWAQKCVGHATNSSENSDAPCSCGGSHSSKNPSALCERFAELVDMIEGARVEWKRSQGPTSQPSELVIPFGVDLLLTPSNVGIDSLQPTPQVGHLDMEVPSVPSIPLSSAENHPLDPGSQYWSPMGGIQVVDIFTTPVSADLLPQPPSKPQGTPNTAFPKRGGAGLGASMAGNALGLSVRSREKAALRISMADLASGGVPRLPMPPVWGGSQENLLADVQSGAVPPTPVSARPKVKWAQENESKDSSAGRNNQNNPSGADAGAGQEQVRPAGRTNSALKATASPGKGIVTTPRGGPAGEGESELSNSCHSQSGSGAIARSWHPTLGGALSQPNVPVLSRNNTSVELANNEFGAYLMASLRKVPTLQGTLMELDTGFTVIADFEVVAELGRGTYGTVSLGVDTEGEMFAIKTLHNGTRIARNGSKKGGGGGGTLSASSSLNAPRSPGIVPIIAQSELEETAVDREIAVMKRLNHPNVVKLHAVIEDAKENQTHLVMQYIENGPPTKINRDGTCKPLPVPLALFYMTQVASGLGYLHHCDIIHRDVKPENILTDSKFVAYVADFGVSSILKDKRGGALTSRAGTMAFMAPELIASASAAAEFGKEADIWAFGISLYCMVFGKLPFYGRTAPELMNAIITQPLQFPDSLPSADQHTIGGDTWQIPEGEEEECYRSVRTLLERLLMKDPKGRMSLRSFRRHPYVQRYAVNASGGAELQSDTSYSAYSDADSSTTEEGVADRTRIENSDDAPLPSGQTTTDGPPKRHIENPRRIRENITDGELRLAVSRCAVGMYRKQCASSYEVQELLSRFVARFRARFQKRKAAAAAAAPTK
jgi:serine/threonine protein kinase